MARFYERVQEAMRRGGWANPFPTMPKAAQARSLRAMRREAERRAMQLTCDPAERRAMVEAEVEAVRAHLYARREPGCDGR